MFAAEVRFKLTKDQKRVRGGYCSYFEVLAALFRWCKTKVLKFGSSGCPLSLFVWVFAVTRAACVSSIGQGSVESGDGRSRSGLEERWQRKEVVRWQVTFGASRLY